jgi:hypothetical protein
LEQQQQLQQLQEQQQAAAVAALTQQQQAVQAQAAAAAAAAVQQAGQQQMHPATAAAAAAALQQLPVQQQQQQAMLQQAGFGVRAGPSHPAAAAAVGPGNLSAALSGHAGLLQPGLMATPAAMQQQQQQQQQHLQQQAAQQLALSAAAAAAAAAAGSNPAETDVDMAAADSTVVAPIIISNESEPVSVYACVCVGMCVCVGGCSWAVLVAGVVLPGCTGGLCEQPLGVCVPWIDLRLCVLAMLVTLGCAAVPSIHAVPFPCC